jgi:L-threonylcarbamoyladenylate synthase
MISMYKTLRPKALAAQILAGEVGVIPTDTLYGIVGSALNPVTVEKIYKLRRRDVNKPMIVLVGSVDDLGILGIRINKFMRDFLQQYWPGAISIVLPCRSKKLAYLHRGGETLAVRLPKYPELVKLLKITGPVVAPSANWAGEPPAATVRMAQKYFPGDLDFCVDVGKLNGKPSTLVKLDSAGRPEVIREGSVRIKM